MELAQLEAVEAVARLGTMTGAARELRMSQPALSRSIARLERELGCELFERSRAGARPTAAGLVAAAPSVRFADLDGLAFLASSAARFWLARVRSQCPRSEITEFDDPGVLARSLEPAGALSFVVGDDGRPPRTAGGYAAVPVEGDAAAATFHLVAREGAQGPAEELMRRVAGARGR